MRATRRWSWLAAGVAASLFAVDARAARVASVSPQGEVAVVRQVVVRFDQAVVAAGDPRAAAPFKLTCNGRPASGGSRWTGDRAWVHDFAEPLAAGVRCTLQADPRFVPLGGDGVEGPREYAFSTGAPTVVSVQPYAGATIDEDQHFLLRLNGVADHASVRTAAWCEVQGLGERIPVRIVEGSARDEVLRRRARSADPATTLLLACARAFAPGQRVRLVWGRGIAAATQPALVSRNAQRWEWTVRERFTAEFNCERENAQAACLPLRPLVLRFSAPVARAAAMASRLVPAPAAGGSAGMTPIAPQAGREPAPASATVTEIRFAAPLPEGARFTIALPSDLRDDAGRVLANAASFPLAVATGALPPLAKFAGAPFGIVEAGADPADAAHPALLPVTLRHVQADVAGASTGGSIRIRRFDTATPDAELLRWLGRLRADHDDAWNTRARPLLAGDAQARRVDLPPAAAATPRATEVVGIPLPQRGYHVVEVESRILGHALLQTRAPMHARTGALVTNLGVHFKRGRSSSLVWVTTLDRARPVAGARVAVNDCRGQALWTGTTGADGTVRIDRGFDAGTEEAATAAGKCLGRDGLFVTARHGDDLSFVCSDWHRGIEPWRFDLPTAQGLQADRRAHTVFDRTLLRAGETVSMKHYVRDDTEAGLALPPAAELPAEVSVTHVATGTEAKLPLAWPRGARAAESRWVIPRTAALGLYDVTLRRGDRQLAAGSFRVEAFRVPLVDARLAGPPGVLVAPREVAYALQLQASAGGPMPGTPVTLSALLRPASVAFAGHEDYAFSPPGVDRGSDAADEPAGDAGKLVADKVAAITDQAGAARLTAGALPAIATPSELLAEATFTDPNGEVQTVAQRTRLWPAAVVAGLRVPGWAAARGDAGITAVVLDPQGRPLAGRTVEVSGRLHRTLTIRKRIVGGFYGYDNRRETRELGALCSGSTDGQGRLTCSVKLDQAGEVELVATARDDAGRASQAATTVWVSQAGGDWWFEQDNDDRIELVPERRDVEPGGTARLQVRMPYRRATALVTVEREGIVDSRVVTLTGREPVIELPVPRGAARAWAPNVVVSVLVLRGRVREAPWWSLFTWGWRDAAQWWQAFRHESPDHRAPTAGADLSRPSHKMGAAMLAVGLADHRLDVQVLPARARYRVRETVPTTVRVMHRGQPLAGAEIAFAAVDEGLLALQANRSWDLLGGLMQPRPWGVETSTAQGEVIGRRHYGRKTLPPGGGGGRNPTRELFDTLLLWRGTVVLDAHGTARIDVPLNDSLTSFRLVAIADAGDRFGTGSASVLVSQELQLLPGLPQVLRAGDRFDATLTLRNTTARTLALQATLAAKVDIGAAAATSIGLPPQTVSLAAGAAQEVRWTVQVPAGALRIDWTAEASETRAAGAGAAILSDRVQVAQAVLPAVPLRVWQASLQRLDGTLALPLAAPAGALAAPAGPLADGSASALQAGGAQPGTVGAASGPASALRPAGGVQATLQPRLSGALPGVRRYFEAYPYGCLEQRASRAIGLGDAAAWQQLGTELPGYLDGDGLAAWFPAAAGDAARGSDRLTAYLLAVAHEAGWTWPEATRGAMLGGLAAFVEGRIERRPAAPRPDLAARKLSALEALARHGRVQPRMIDSVAWSPAVWPTSALLDAWSLYRRVDALPDRAARLSELQRLLRSRLVAAATTLRFATEADDEWWWLMEGGDANANRLLLAAIATPEWHADLPALVTGALARQRRGAWSTTTANAWGVLALDQFGARFDAAAVTGRSLLQWSGAAQSHDWSAEPGGGTRTLPWPAGASPAALQARHEGSGRPWLALQTLAAVPLRAPLFAGYRLKRTVTAVERRRPDAWSRGDVARVRIEIEAGGDMAWVVVADPLPAGAAVLGSGLGRDSVIATRGEGQGGGLAWPTHVERGTAAWRGYFEWLPRGRHAVEYTVRFSTAGRFGLPPTRAEAMYAPDSFGELPNESVEVQP